jgi:hypothetical protein
MAAGGDPPVRLISDDPAFRTPGTEAEEAARRRRGTPEPPDIPGDLEFLEHHWGSAYLIGRQGGQFTAVRRDGRGGTLAAGDRDGLATLIADDYRADPVPRDLP